MEQCKNCVLQKNEAHICKNCSHYGEMKRPPHYGELQRDDDDPVIDYWCNKHYWSSPPWESCNDFVSD